MANVYVRSGASGAGTGADWANAYTTLSAALAAKAAGDVFYVSEDHAETQATTMTLTSPGTNASPCVVLCVDHAGSVPPVSANLRTTATITTTGNSSLLILGALYVYGITFNCGSGNVNVTIQVGTKDNSACYWQRYENCNFNVVGVGGSSGIQTGNNSGNNMGFAVEWLNCTVKFASSGQRLYCKSRFCWSNTNAAAINAAGTIPIDLFGPGIQGLPCDVYCSGLDLSSLGSGKGIIQPYDEHDRFTFENCKLGASVLLARTGGTTGLASPIIRYINCDSTSSNYRYYKWSGLGEVFSESTIVRSGGASNGTTTTSLKLVSNAITKFYAPLQTDAIEFWNETTGSSVTVSIPIVNDGVTLKNSDVWLEVEYLGTSGFPVSSFANNRTSDFLASGSNHPTDSSSSWTTTGLASPVKQTLSVSFTPQMKGLVKCRVMLARASTTLYFDPKALSTSGRQYRFGESGFVNEGAAGGVFVGSGDEL